MEQVFRSTSVDNKMLLGQLLKGDGLMGRMFSIKSMLLAATLSLVGTVSASAERLIFLNAKAGNIIGTSTFKGHEGEVILSGFSANIASANAVNPANPPVPPPQRAAATVCGRFTITKMVDQTSPDFIRLVLSGQHISNATITFANNT